jgi:hypothetical protein
MSRLKLPSLDELPEASRAAINVVEKRLGFKAAVGLCSTGFPGRANDSSRGRYSDGCP